MLYCWLVIKQVFRQRRDFFLVVLYPQQEQRPACQIWNGVHMRMFVSLRSTETVVEVDRPCSRYHAKYQDGVCKSTATMIARQGGQSVRRLELRTAKEIGELHVPSIGTDFITSQLHCLRSLGEACEMKYVYHRFCFLSHLQSQASHAKIKYPGERIQRSGGGSSIHWIFSTSSRL